MSKFAGRNELTIIGGGLAGSEAAWQAAHRDIKVTLFEMRPVCQTGAHTTSELAELVCSNSFGSVLPDRAPGVLKAELHQMGSLLLSIAEKVSVPAGGALAVDRELFSEEVTRRLATHPNIQIVREEVVDIPGSPAIIASGPLTSTRLSHSIQALTGQDHLFFFDAIAPIVILDSINLEVAYRASRYGRGEQEEGDYINCPMTRYEYETFIDALLSAERIELKSFESDIEAGVQAGASEYFEGCLPVEVLARRGRDALAFGPMKPVGLKDPQRSQRPHAVVQLRQDNLAGTLYNLVGFQTNLKFPEQRRVFRTIPGLENAEFVRYGQMHRNTFINSPKLLRPTLQFRHRDDLFFAGQITGIEGYMGNIASGLLAGWNAARLLKGNDPLILPATTMLGALCNYITSADEADFQPMKANFGILPELESALKGRSGKRQRAEAYANRAFAHLHAYLQEHREMDG
ncbi:MAG: methylenetetrahydrofolate--tRNA-(uracil(54)-C(5))-methyltransferase (FADH(2)-oxidizing) TrmFO [Omnitrophica WOR_2 bacterium]